MKSVKRQKKKLVDNSFKRSECPLSCTLDIIGDKWTLLVIRDLLRGKSRFNAFLGSKEGITTNILANRLLKLEQAGLISKKPYQDNPVRYDYELTVTGESLKPVLFSIVDWAHEYIPGTGNAYKYLSAGNHDK